MVRSNRPVLVSMERGSAAIACGSFRAELAGNRAALLARSGVATLDMSRDGIALAVSFDRAAFQQALSLMVGVPHQLVAGNAQVLLPAAAPALIATLAEPGRAGGHDDTALMAMLTAALESESGGFSLLQPVEPLIRAISYVASHLDSTIDGAAIARAAGLGLRSLQRAFRDVLGVSLGQHILQLQLEHVRHLLASGFETRSIQEIANAAGFKSPTAFARAYSRRFGESPSMTRARKANESIVI